MIFLKSKYYWNQNHLWIIELCSRNKLALTEHSNPELALIVAVQGSGDSVDSTARLGLYTSIKYLKQGLALNRCSISNSYYYVSSIALSTL